MFMSEVYLFRSSISVIRSVTYSAERRTQNTVNITKLVSTHTRDETRRPTHVRVYAVVMCAREQTNAREGLELELELLLSPEELIKKLTIFTWYSTTKHNTAQHSIARYQDKSDKKITRQCSIVHSVQ